MDVPVPRCQTENCVTLYLAAEVPQTLPLSTAVSVKFVKNRIDIQSFHTATATATATTATTATTAATAATAVATTAAATNLSYHIK